MSSVITVRMPDALAERLEPLKGQMNVSEICRNALESKIQMYEAIEQALSDEDVMRGLVDRLKIQKKEASDRSYSMGEEDGKDWAIKEATYQELGKWGRRNTRHYRTAETPWEAELPDDIDPYTGDPLVEIKFPDSKTARRHLDTRRKECENENQPFELDLYRYGFMDAVKAIWSKVEGEL